MSGMTERRGNEKRKREKKRHEEERKMRDRGGSWKWHSLRAGVSRCIRCYVVWGVTVEASLVSLFPLIFGCVASRSACEWQFQPRVRRTRHARNDARYECRRIIALISRRTEQGRCCKIDRSRVSLIIYRDNTLIRSSARIKERTGNLLNLFNFTRRKQNDQRIRREPGEPDCNFSIKL